MRASNADGATTIGAVALGALAGALLARAWRGEAECARAARPACAPGLAAGMADRGDREPIRPTGAESLRDPVPDRDARDEARDEAFASGPPATHRGGKRVDRAFF